ncbi:Strictosidine synthase/Gluconolaconase-like protein, partial [Euroglyphus maynei]
VKLPDSFSGPLLVNQWLSLADHLYDREIRGPESFATWNADGRIIQLLPNTYRTVTYLNPENRSQEECRKNFQSSSGHCARPLGMRFSSKGQLFVIDPYHGVFEIDIDSGEYRLVMNIDEHRLPDGSRAKFLDDLVLIENDDTMLIYMTDASQKWLLHDVYYTVGEMDQTGRLLSFNMKTQELRIELDNLAFPNGLVLNDNKTIILLNEFNKRRILRYRLEDKHLDILVDGLPGEPDNIKRSLDKYRETYWIGLFTGRNQHKPSFYLDIMANYSHLKRAYFRMIRLVGFVIEMIGHFLLCCDRFIQFGHDIRVANFMYPIVAQYGMAIEIDSNGKIIGSLHSPDGHTSQLSETTFDILLYTTIISIIFGLLPDQFFNDFPIKPIKYENEHLYKGLYGFEWNDHLVGKTKMIAMNQIHGPESLVDSGDYIYTGVLGGRIVRIHKQTEQIDEIVRFNNSKQCQHEKLKAGDCGRFLGLRERGNDLYVVEANTGIYRVDLKKKVLIHLSKNLIPENESAIINDLVFDPKHSELVYITVSSSKWSLDRIAWSIVDHDQSGYVLALNLSTGQSHRIADGFTMANGIEITADQKYLLICQTTDFSIVKIDLKMARQISRSKQSTLKAKQLELFGQRLPGEVDNIRLDASTGDLLLGMFTVRPNSKVLRDYLSHWPFIRKSFARTAYALYLLMDYIDNKVISLAAIEQLRDDLYTGHIVYKTLPQRDGAVIRLDGQTGHIKQIFGSSKFFGISEAIIDAQGDLYYGSFRNSFIGRISKNDHQSL